MREYNRSMTLDNFVVFEGMDGSGTSTQLNLLRGRISSRTDVTPWFTWEPTDGPLGLLLRQALRGEIKLAPATLAHLFAADRSEHLEAANGIKRHTEQGELVICDRYVLSSLVYQGIECGESLPALLNEGFPRPELLFLFDLSPETAAERYQKRESRDIYERIDFQKIVRSRYRQLAKHWCGTGTRLVIIDAAKTIDEVAEDIWREVAELPIFRR